MLADQNNEYFEEKDYSNFLKILYSDLWNLVADATEICDTVYKFSR